MAHLAGAAVHSYDDLVVIAEGGGLGIPGLILPRDMLPEFPGGVGADAEIAAAVARIAAGELGLVAPRKRDGGEQQGQAILHRSAPNACPGNVAQPSRNDKRSDAISDEIAGARRSAKERMFMVQQMVKRARALYPGMVTLQSDLLPRGEGRREDEARWAEREMPEGGAEIGGGDGWDMIAGGIGGDRLLPEHDPDAPWNDGKSIGAHRPTKLPYDFTGVDNAQITHSSPSPTMASVDAMQRNREAKNVTYSRLWPVPGDGRPARDRETAPNGKKYFDGRFAPKGEFRKYPNGNPKPHYGVDLPAATGTAVVAADDGIVLPPVVDRTGKNFGTSVRLGYDGEAEQGLYGHLSSVEPLPVGTRVKRGQKIGEVGTSGNAKGGGDHLHYEVRQAKIAPKTKADITWNRPSQAGGRPVYPGHRVSRRNPSDK